MPTITVERNEHFHRGPVCYRQDKRGRVTVMCPYGHLIATVEPGEWASSVWAYRASWGEYSATCHGKLRADAEPYPFSDTFMGRVQP